jgi:hypothetical protein
MKISLLAEDALAVVVFAIAVGVALFPVLSLEPEPERSVVAFRQPLPERCKFPEKVEGCGDQQWLVQGCEPFSEPEITCVSADLRKARK